MLDEDPTFTYNGAKIHFSDASDTYSSKYSFNTNCLHCKLDSYRKLYSSFPNTPHWVAHLTEDDDAVCGSQNGIWMSNSFLDDCFASDGLSFWLAKMLSCGALGCGLTNSEPRVACPKVLRLDWYRLVGDL
jgi:hypothetical protein